MLIRGRNCARTIEKCIRSIRRQTYPYWKAVISLDVPTDNSVEFTEKIIGADDRFKLSCNAEHLGVCGNMYNILFKALYFRPGADTFCAIVDADDFIAKDALATVAQVICKEPNVKITHGSYMKLSKKRRTKISNVNIQKGNIRKMPWRSSHLKVINWQILLKGAKAEWFQHKGKWLQAASDLALMFPCIEIAGLENVRHIHKIIYYWNDHVTKKKRALQKKCEKIIRAKKAMV